MKFHKHLGFTLIELLIYMGILAVIVAIVFLIIKNEHSVSLTYELSSISAGGDFTSAAITSLTSRVGSISAGDYYTCAVKNGLVYCWGKNDHGQLGDNTNINRYTPVQVKGVEGKDYLTNVIQVAAGGYHTCALKTDGTVYCWGGNSSGQLGDNTNTHRYTPVQVKGVGGEGYLTDITQISAGGYHTCALKTNGAVYCWGNNSFGQLSDNTDINRYTPVQVKGVGGEGYLTDITQISAGGYHACVLKTNGAVYCWGANYNGQLGDYTDTHRYTPVPVNVFFI